MLLPSEQLVAKISTLPPVSAALEEVLNLLDNGVSDWVLIGRKILGDPVLCGRLLRLANSSFYGLSGRVKSIESACVLLGANTVRNLIYTLMVMSRFRQDGTATVLNHTAIWQHSLRVGCLMKLQARRIPVAAEIAFMVGLFHSLGFIIEDYFFPDLLQQSMAWRHEHPAHAQPPDTPVTEDMHLCAELLAYWKFPTDIIEVFAGSQSAQAIQMRNLLNNCCGVLGAENIPCAPWLVTAELAQHYSEQLQLTSQELTGLMENSHSLYEEMSQAMFH